MHMGLSHDSENPNETYIILFVVRVWSYTSSRSSDPILASCFTTEMTDDEKHQLRLQELEALDDKRPQAQ